MRNRRFISILLTLCMALSLLPTSALAAAEQYTDVKAGAWYYEDVDFVTDKGYFKGMSDTIFAPDETMTRAMFVTVLSRYAEAKVDDTTSTFTDVPAGTWYTGAVTWAAKKGIVEGRGNGIFDPNGAVTREEMCTILDRYLKAYDLDAKLAKKPATITDLETVSAWAVEAVEDCVAFGVIIGYPDGTFGPKITASRAHVAAILHRLQIIVDESDGPSTETYEAVYIGVKDFTELDTDETPEEEFVHLFYIDGDVEEFDIKDTEAFTLENKLRAGYIYTIKVRDDVVTSVAEAAVETGVAADFDLEDKDLYEIESPIAPSGAVVKEVDSIAADATVKVTENAVYKAFVAEDYTAPVIPTPGLKTLKNFLATALHPVGTALYVYGGAWDWQDDESSNQSITIGIPQEWIDTFQSQDTTYHYKKKDASGSHADSFYTSNRGWNQYYWAGVDCSAYVGWTVWNTLNTENGVQGKDGYVMSSTNQAYNFANLGWGTYDKGEYKLNGAGEIYADGDGDSHRLFDTADFNVGDVFSDNGHVWICLGVCEDGSMVFMHSTPSTSRDGLGEGGGIQISALDLEDRDTCEAAELADYYMSKYYPEWNERYGAVTKGSSYVDVYDNGVPGTEGFSARKAGRFSWDLENGVLTDPDGYADMTPAEILADLYGEELDTDPDYTAMVVEAATKYIDGLLDKGFAATGVASADLDAEYDDATVTVTAKGELNEAHLKAVAKMAVQVATTLVYSNDIKSELKETEAVQAVIDALTALGYSADVNSKDELKALAKEIAADAKAAALELRDIVTLKDSYGSYPFESVAVKCGDETLFVIDVADGLNKDSIDRADPSKSIRESVKAIAKALAPELHEALQANVGPTNTLDLVGSLTLVMDVKDDIAEQCTDTFTLKCEATLSSDLVTYECKDGKDYLTVTVTEDMQAAYDAAADLAFAKLMPYLRGEKQLPTMPFAMRAVDASLLDKIDINKYLTPDVLQALTSNNNEALYEVMDEVIAESVSAEEIEDMGIDVADLANTFATGSEEVKAELEKVIVKPAVEKVQEVLAEKGIEASETLATYATYTVLDKVMNDEIKKTDSEAKVEYFAPKAEEAKKEVIESGELDTLIDEQVRPEADKAIDEALSGASEKLGFELTKEHLALIADLSRFETMKEKKLGGILPLLKIEKLDDKGNGLVSKVAAKLDELMLFVPADATVSVDGKLIDNDMIQALRNAESTKALREAVVEIVEVLGGLSISSFEDGAEVVVTAYGYEYAMNLTVVVE